MVSLKAVSILITDCARSFKRKIPQEIVKELTGRIFQAEGSSKESRDLRLVRTAVRLNHTYKPLTKVLPDVIRYLESRFLEAEAAREALFRFDTLEETGCDVEFEIEGLDEILSGKFCNCESYS